ncbi:MAG: 50S ribosomal protein L25 [Deltaproteobacteria bacterium]|nr:50S ribosomal protein L25 [Deltaproteobacteria bacterium]
MDFHDLEVSVRLTRGKGAARRLRRAELAPGVIYGKNAAVQPVTLVPSVLVKALAGPLRVNTPLNIIVNDPVTKKKSAVLAIVKDHQYDPITRELLHVDFLAIDENQHIEVTVPIIKTGRSIGEQMGGILRMVRRNVKVSCTPHNIPESIIIDASQLKNNITLHVSEVDMPEGVTINLPPNKAILTISAISNDDDKAEDVKK